MILEGAHFLQLLLDAPTPFEGDLDQLSQLCPGDIAVRVEQLDQTRDRLTNGFYITGQELNSSRERSTAFWP